MDILFASDKLQAFCVTKKKAARKWGPNVAKILMRRLYELQAADSLSDFDSISPGSNLHLLKGGRDGQYAVRLAEGKCLIVLPANDPSQWRTPDGTDLRAITGVKILEVVNYHD